MSNLYQFPLVWVMIPISGSHCDGNEGRHTPGAGLDLYNKYSLYLSPLASEGVGDTDPFRALA